MNKVYTNWTYIVQRMPFAKAVLSACLITFFMLNTRATYANTLDMAEIQDSASGVVTDASGMPLPGVTVLKKGKNDGTITDFDGKYSIPAEKGDILVFSFLGMKTQEITVGDSKTINVALQDDASILDEVVIIGYGTQKKINVTGSVSVAKGDQLQDRPISNVTQALQGLIPGLTISTTNGGGEPGATMNLNIRGAISLSAGESPFVLVDGIPMDMNNINPNDIASISVLKDAASTAIYGANGAFGVILITTKNGNKNRPPQFSYRGNVSISNPTIWPDLADAMSYALTMNESQKNVNGGSLYTDETLERLAQNIANPGSAPTLLPHANGSGLAWNHGPMGVNAAGNTDWKSFLFNDHSYKQFHNLSVSGGSEKIDYYLSAGFLNDGGLMKYGEEFFKRYNLDAKVNADVNSWAKVSLVTKYRHSEQDFPWDYQYGRGRAFDLISKLKVTMPLYYPDIANQDPANGYYPDSDVFVNESRIYAWGAQRENTIARQLVISPRLILEPIKNWETNIELNYRTNDGQQTYTAGQFSWLQPNGDYRDIPARASTTYRPRLTTNSYFAPIIRSSYKYSLNDIHNFKVMIGYQHEQFKSSNLNVDASGLLSDDIPSVSTAVGVITADDDLDQWGTQSFFGRLNYNYKEKYILEANIRRDGSSKFDAQNEKFGTFPSFSGAWIASKEKFFPFKKTFNLLKIRGSYGTLGNQNVSAGAYIPTMGTSLGNFLMGGERPWTVGAPALLSQNLTWESVEKTDIAIEFGMLNNRFSGTIVYYDQKNVDQVGPGEIFPSVLGAGSPKKNIGEVTTQGWELELSWSDKIGEVKYGLRGVLSDYIKREITKYPSANNTIGTYYPGRQLGDIWGFETAGYFQSEDDITAHGVNQNYIRNTRWFPGDLKYVDQNGDDTIGIGSNTEADPGDQKVIGNSNARMQYAINGNVSWKGFDMSFLIQGVGKKDADIRGGTFRGPANGRFHATVFKEHLDFWRDESSPLGANPNAYFPRPYSQNPGNNNKNYRFPTTQFIQDASYVRLKNIQLGYTIPEAIASKGLLQNARIYVSGENLVTLTDLLFFDPETISGSWGVGKAYPLSKTISLGLNINF